MPTFKNLKQLEKYVQKKVEGAVKSEAVASIFKYTMSEKVQSEVYDYYPDPRVYDRREKDGGLSDERNMVFTEHTKVNNTLVSLFENLTVGNERELNIDSVPYSADSMKGYFISSLIENGSNNVHTSSSNSENGWYELGKWSDPRPFAKATANELNSTGTPLNNALKATLEHKINN